MQWLPFLILTWLLVGFAVAAWYARKTVLSLWREATLKQAVLIIESDDWGAGPLEQATQLDRIARVLASHRNQGGQKPVMTLGVVLGVPDGARMVSESLSRYHRKSVDHAEFGPVISAMKRGVESGVFALQLHGGEHYWPQALLTAAKKLPTIAAWLANSVLLETETLPAPLQSRWIDASQLPSEPLDAREVALEAAREIKCFRQVFGSAPVVAVAPTFVWNDVVENAWARNGIKVVVTPGCRYIARDANGKLVAERRAILNGQQGAAGITYLVRDEYFEPCRGHRAGRGLEALARKAALARPLLLETHRSNFLGAMNADMALGELDRLLTIAREAFPRLLFMSSEALARRIRDRDPELIEMRVSVRIHIWLRRLWAVSRVRKLAWVTGMIVPGCVLYLCTRPRSPDAALVAS